MDLLYDDTIRIAVMLAYITQPFIVTQIIGKALVDKCQQPVHRQKEPIRLQTLSLGFRHFFANNMQQNII
ncbi:hypothetical protein B4V02_24045 [Paenibacillus kribbensis]|uniref:Uncharacterized protein n=1 Tax=Paenibacillus kribbensis TaxID=172713 RepID=A0A222WU56_9BACL|nr:hypothetical protein B4V02_24045 [Paenibacillus kribbensis]